MEQKSRNSFKGIIRDKMLKGRNWNYSRLPQRIGSDRLRTFYELTRSRNFENEHTSFNLNAVTASKSFRIFYRVVHVDVFVPKPLRCFSCQRFRHHETNCPVAVGSVCEKCGTGGQNHKNSPKCINYIKDDVCKIWKKEKETWKLKSRKTSHTWKQRNYLNFNLSLSSKPEKNQ